MALDGASLKAKMKSTIEAGLAKNFPEVSATAQYGGVSKEMWTKIADAISGIALDIVADITSKAEVPPGIPVDPSKGMTVGPGKVT